MCFNSSVKCSSSEVPRTAGKRRSSLKESTYQSRTCTQLPLVYVPPPGEHIGCAVQQCGADHSSVNTTSLKEECLTPPSKKGIHSVLCTNISLL